MSHMETITHMETVIFLGVFVEGVGLCQHHRRMCAVEVAPVSQLLRCLRPLCSTEMSYLLQLSIELTYTVMRADMNQVITVRLPTDSGPCGGVDIWEEQTAG